jgi:hypothetical protein
MDSCHGRCCVGSIVSKIFKAHSGLRRLPRPNRSPFFDNFKIPPFVQWQDAGAMNTESWFEFIVSRMR